MIRKIAVALVVVSLSGFAAPVWAEGDEEARTENTRSSETQRSDARAKRAKAKKTKKDEKDKKDDKKKAKRRSRSSESTEQPAPEKAKTRTRGRAPK